MSCEKPVIVFNSGRTSDLLKHMKNGILIDNNDLSDFVEKLKLLQKDKENCKISTIIN